MAAKTGAHDGPGMWIPAGSGARAGPCRVGGGSVRNRRMVQISQTTTRTMIAIGISATRAFQSGVTRSAVVSRNQFQMSSSMGGPAQPGAAADRPVTRAIRR